jgi:hypothetical protein
VQEEWDPIEPEDPEFAALLSTSHLKVVGVPLAPGTPFEDRPPVDAARWLYRDAPFVLLAHRLSADPVFCYANLAAQRTFGYSWDEFIGLPSRYSAATPDRAERDRLFERVASYGFSKPVLAAPGVEHPAFALGGAAGAAVAPGHRQHRLRRWRRGVVDEAGRCLGGTHPPLDHPDDLHDPGRLVHPGAHLVAGGDHGGWFGGQVVDPDVTPSARGRGIRAGFGEPHRPQPAIYPGGLHPAIMAGPAPVCRRLAGRARRG